MAKELKTTPFEEPKPKKKGLRYTGKADKIVVAGVGVFSTKNREIWPVEEKYLDAFVRAKDFEIIER